MTDNVLVTNMTWMEYEHRVKQSSPAVMIPVGSVEQLGPHLPLLTDTLVPAGICERVAKRTGNLVAPPITYGCKSLPRSGGGQHFPRTTSLDASVLIARLEYIIAEFGRHGVARRAVPSPRTAMRSQLSRRRTAGGQPGSGQTTGNPPE